MSSTSKQLRDYKQITMPLWMGLSILKNKGLKVSTPKGFPSSIHSLKKPPAILKHKTEKGAYGITFVNQKMKTLPDFCIPRASLLSFRYPFPGLSFVE